MPIQPLPEDPSFENLKKRAKALLTSVRAGDAIALAYVKELHPRASAALAKPTLAAAQLVVARAYGFPSWAKVKQHLEVVERFHWAPRDAAARAAETEVDAFLRNACLVYGDWSPASVERARQALVARPELARASVYAAASAGDVVALREHLERDLTLVRAKGGPLDWEPLLYAAYSRLDRPLPGCSTLAAARLLLEKGADPNAGFLWHGNTPPFTALTGAFGEGEDGNNQPPHPECAALARLLLEAGADPNDGQTLYNKHFRANDDHLRLLFEFGLGQDRRGALARRGPWFARLGERMQSPQQMLVEELWAAAQKGYAERVALLLAHGVDPNGRSFRDRRTPHEAAVRSGNRAIAEMLVRHGAKAAELAPAEALAAALVAGDRAQVDAWLARRPGLLEELDRENRAELVRRAVEAHNPEGLRRMAALGFDLSPLTRNTPLHEAAWAGDLAMVRLLIELGADPSVREPTYRGTPLGWARHNHQHAVVEFLLPHADVFDAVTNDGVERLAELLQENPDRARALDPEGRALVFHVHAGLQRAPELLALLRASGADLDAVGPEQKTALEVALAGGNTALADLLRRHGARG